MCEPLSWRVLLVAAVLVCVAREGRGLAVKLGMLSPFRHVRLGWETNAAAATMALDRARSEGLLPGTTVSFHWEDDKCSSTQGAGKAVFMRYNVSVDAYIGPPCSASTKPAGLLAAYWNVPMFTPASSDPVLGDKVTYRTLVRLGPPFNRMGAAFVEIFRHFGWSRVVIVSRRKVDNRNVFCDYSSRATVDIFFASNITVADHIIIGDSPTDSEIDEMLARLRYNGRIFILCTEMAAAKRRILLRVRAAGMLDGSYVIFIPDYLPPANVRTPWVTGAADDGLVKQIYRYIFQITVSEIAGPEVESFRDELPLRMAEPPWNYNFTMLSGRRGSQYSPFLHDVVYLYLLVLNETLMRGLDHRNGTLLFDTAKHRRFTGVTGDVMLDENGDRVPDYWVWSMPRPDDAFDVTLEAKLTSQVLQTVFVQRDVVWPSQDGRLPPDTPACGFFNENCKETVADYVIVTVVFVIVVGVGIGVSIFIYVRRQRLEKELQLMPWKVSYADIVFRKRNCFGSFSQMSLTSSTTGSSVLGGGDPGQQVFTAVGLCGGVVVAVKRMSAAACTVSIDRRQQLHLKKMRELSHENLLPFVGLCLEPEFPCVLTGYCAKGSLQDIIENDDIKLDWMFKQSLITDLVNGMTFIHGSFLTYHGQLKSSKCLVDNRWTLKLADFGLQAFQGASLAHSQHQKMRSLMWAAPELLRSLDTRTRLSDAGWQQADVYSFGIVLHEIAHRCYPYNTETTSMAEIVRRVQAGESPPYRPRVPPREGAAPGPPEKDEPPDSIVTLAAQCWAEDPLDRPPFPVLRAKVAALNKGRKTGIVDNMLQMLEKYATNLEDLVEQRTRDLIEERKRSDTLLYRMLPRLVAERLKQGYQVPPELYQSVTVYFSDIVGFTALASESSPMEIVTFLNDLYTNFDGILANYDVYKVETIGDAYMVVSGLPERNGSRHVTEIANMALYFRRSLGSFTVRHLPDRKLQLRAGIHSGQCAAGVVGLTMPRYCLFGDTVNTASRMESTGLPGRIQASQDSKQLLDETGNYTLSYRGTVEVKGKGQRETYWLDGRTDLHAPDSEVTDGE